MPKTIELLANEGKTLDLTLQDALNLLRARGVRVLGATHVIGNDNDAPTGRILLQNDADCPGALRILAGELFKAF